MPDLDESVVYRSAGGGVHDSEVKDERYSSVEAAMRKERESFTNGYLLLGLPDILAN